MNNQRSKTDQLMSSDVLWSQYLSEKNAKFLNAMFPEESESKNSQEIKEKRDRERKIVFAIDSLLDKSDLDFGKMFLDLTSENQKIYLKNILQLMPGFTNLSQTFSDPSSLEANQKEILAFIQKKYFSSYAQSLDDKKAFSIIIFEISKIQLETQIQYGIEELPSHQRSRTISNSTTSVSVSESSSVQRSEFEGSNQYREKLAQAFQKASQKYGFVFDGQNSDDITNANKVVQQGLKGYVRRYRLVTALIGFLTLGLGLLWRKPQFNKEAIMIKALSNPDSIAMKRMAFLYQNHVFSLKDFTITSLKQYLLLTSELLVKSGANELESLKTMLGNVKAPENQQELLEVKHFLDTVVITHQSRLDRDKKTMPTVISDHNNRQDQIENVKSLFNDKLRSWQAEIRTKETKKAL